MDSISVKSVVSPLDVIFVPKRYNEQMISEIEVAPMELDQRLARSNLSAVWNCKLAEETGRFHTAQDWLLK